MLLMQTLRQHLNMLYATLLSIITVVRFIKQAYDIFNVYMRSRRRSSNGGNDIALRISDGMSNSCELVLQQSSGDLRQVLDSMNSIGRAVIEVLLNHSSVVGYQSIDVQTSVPVSQGGTTILSRQFNTIHTSGTTYPNTTSRNTDQDHPQHREDYSDDIFIEYDDDDFISHNGDDSSDDFVDKGSGVRGAGVEDRLLYPPTPPPTPPSPTNQVQGQDDQPSQSDDEAELIPKPPGEAGRPRRGGYNLFSTLGWEKKLYAECLADVRKVSDKHLNLREPISRQCPLALQCAFNEMNESYPILKQYKDNWVARTMFGNFLRNKRAYFKSRGLL